MHVCVDYISGGCNRSTGCLAWGSDELVAYGCSRNCLVYDVVWRATLCSLQSHEAPVSSVCWVGTAAKRWQDGYKEERKKLLLTGATDGTVCVWAIDTKSPWDSGCCLTLRAGPGPVTSLTVCGCHSDGTVLLLMTAGSGEASVVTLSISRSEEQIAVESELLQRLEVGGATKQPVSSDAMPVRAAPSAGSLHSLVAIGAVDGSVQLWSGAPGAFQRVLSLAAGQDWVKGVSLASWTDPQVDPRLPFDPATSRCLLAACNQDRTVRVWSVGTDEAPSASSSLPSFTAPAAGAAEASEDIFSLAPRPTASIGGHRCAVVLDSLLLGHEDWVHSVDWDPTPPSRLGAPPALLSASMDRTMIRWERDDASGVWISAESVGDAGPSSLGYYSGRFSPSGGWLIGNGYSGALHLWRRRGEGAGWDAVACAVGHVGSVEDICWGGLGGGAYLLSASADQTVRLTTGTSDGGWCEASRAQVHGHDFSCVACLPRLDGAPDRFVSGSEEKVIRVFEAPTTVVESLAAIKGQPLSEADARMVQDRRATARGGLVPALGLSNRAVRADEGPQEASGEGAEDGPMDLVGVSAPAVVTGPPLEEHLAQNTLWPEIQKLYGHGDDLFALAADPMGEIVASASVARSQHAAAIWLWCTRTWRPRGRLHGPCLTVTQLRFSPCGTFLVAAGRDRSVHLFRRRDGEGGRGGDGDGGEGAEAFVAAGSVPKAHGRVVWSADVVRGRDGEALVASGSRDKTVRVWQFQGGAVAAREVVELPPRASGVVAVAWEGREEAGRRVLAVGLENGAVEGWEVDVEGGRAFAAWEIKGAFAHNGSVRCLAWRPGNGGERELASAGSDNTVRIFRLSR